MSPVLGIIASGISGHLTPPYNPGAYYSIGSAVVSTTTGTVTLSNIPTGYKHLQIRGLARSTNSVAADQTQLYFNGDASASSYTFHTLGGNGSSVFVEGYGTGVIGGVTPVVRHPGASATSGLFGVTIIDILDYADTTKYKTVKAFTGYDANGSGQIHLTSGMRINTAAVNSVTFIIQGGGNYAIGTTFELYGVK